MKPKVVVLVPILLHLLDLGKGEPEVGAQIPEPDHLLLFLERIFCVDKLLPVPIVDVIVKAVERIIK